MAKKQKKPGKSAAKKAPAPRAERKEAPPEKANEGRKFSIIGIACAAISIIILPILFGPLAIIFGSMGMMKGDKKYGLIAVILGIVFSIASLIAGLYLLSNPSMMPRI